MSSGNEQTDSILKKAATGYRSTLFTQAIRVLCKIVSVVVMARIVAPEGFGQFAMAASAFWMLALFRDAGLGTAAVQARTLDQRQLNSLFSAHLLIGGVLTGLTWLVAPVVAHWFRSAPVTPIMQSMSGAFLIIGAGGFVRTQLQRNLQINRANRVEAIGAVVGTIAMVAAGMADFGPYSFVVFLLVSEGVSTVLAWRETTWRPNWTFHPGCLMPLWRVGRRVTLNQALAFLATQLDGAAIGRWFGSHSLGLYSRSSQLLTLPTQFIALPLGQVLVATLSRLSPTSDQFERHAANTVTPIAHLVLPCYALCIVMPDTTIHLLLGSDWLAASPLLRALAIGSAATTLILMAQSINIATGRTNRLTHAAAVTIPLTLVAIYLGFPYGVDGIALGVAGAQFLSAIPRLWWLLRDTPGAVRNYGSALIGPGITMAILMLGLSAGDRMGGAMKSPALQLLIALGIALIALTAVATVLPRLRRELIATLQFIAGLRSSNLAGNNSRAPK